MLSSILILIFETNQNSNIKQPADAVWWCFVTMTTVGYGDFFPVTNQGRALGIFLMITGVSLFGVITASLAKIFVREEVSTDRTDEILEELRFLREEIERISKESLKK